jgi:hypothetical protein
LAVSKNQSYTGRGGHRDRSKEEHGQDRGHDGRARECGYAGRQFTFGEGKADEVAVLDMTGQRRG